jgi:predicted nucleotidyltransferase
MTLVKYDYQLFLFGSRASGVYDDKADTDIGILPKRTLSPTQIQLIKDEIEKIPTLLKIDFIDFSTVSENFKSVALKNKKEIIL